jgi:hypothetical protein
MKIWRLIAYIKENPEIHENKKYTDKRLLHFAVHAKNDTQTFKIWYLIIVLHHEEWMEHIPNNKDNCS